MKLNNPFPLEVRTLYLYCWECWICGENGTRHGGLELHHILGRVSDCAFNSSCLCKKCHNHIGHSQEEHRKIFFKTMQFLFAQHYQPTIADLEFFEKHNQELNSDELNDYLHNLRVST